MIEEEALRCISIIGLNQTSKGHWKLKDIGISFTVQLIKLEIEMESRFRKRKKKRY